MQYFSGQERQKGTEKTDPQTPSLLVATQAADSWVPEGGNLAKHLSWVIQQPSPWFYRMLGAHALGYQIKIVYDKFQSNL